MSSLEHPLEREGQKRRKEEGLENLKWKNQPMCFILVMAPLTRLAGATFMFLLAIDEHEEEESHPFSFWNEFISWQTCV